MQLTFEAREFLKRMRHCIKDSKAMNIMIHRNMHRPHKIIPHLCQDAQSLSGGPEPNKKPGSRNIMISVISDTEQEPRKMARAYISNSNTLLRCDEVAGTRPPTAALNAYSGPQCLSSTLKVRNLVVQWTLRRYSKRTNLRTLSLHSLLFFFWQAIFLNENIFSLFLSLYFQIRVLVSMPLIIFNCWWTILHLVNLCWQQLVDCL